MSDKPVVGFIGLGPMGFGMAGRILAAGFPLWVRGRRDRKPVEDMVARGAREAKSLAEMAAACDIIHICVSNSAQVEELVRGDGGLLSAARPGLILIDCTTADPVSTQALAAELAGKGVRFVDAPLGRTPKEAAEGKLDAMIGCDEDLLPLITPVIETWAGRILRIGPVGSGHKMKLIMNFISMSYGAIYSEAYVLGAKVGLTPRAIRDVIGPSRLGNGFFDTFSRYVVDRDREAHRFSIANAAKDLRYVNTLATEARVMNVMAAAARHYFAHAEAIGRGEDYVPMLSDHVAALSGIDLADFAQTDDDLDGA